MGLSQDYADLARIWPILGLFRPYPGPGAWARDIGQIPLFQAIWLIWAYTGMGLYGHIRLYTGVQAYIQAVYSGMGLYRYTPYIPYTG